MFLAFLFFSTLSFNTTSFLVLYVALFTITEFLFFQNTKEYYKKLFLISLLILFHAALFYIVKVTYFPTFGVYSTYNKLEFNIVIILKMIAIHGPFYFLEPLLYSFFGKDLISSNTRTVMIISSFILYFPLIWAIYKKDYKTFFWILASIGLILAAVFPYVIVGKLPYTYNWDSRHQLLIPLGASLWLMFVMSFLKTNKHKYIFGGLTLFAFSFGTVRMYLSVQGLRYQDLALQNVLSKSIDRQAPAAYILLNRESAPGMMSHDWSFYELTGMLYKITGRQNNPIILASHYAAFKDPQNWVLSFGPYQKRYMVEGAEWKPPFYCIKLIETNHMNELQAFLYLFDEYFNTSDVFDANIEKIYKFEKVKAELKDQLPIRC